jgi:hypothetical protein
MAIPLALALLARDHATAVAPDSTRGAPDGARIHAAPAIPAN